MKITNLTHGLMILQKYYPKVEVKGDYNFDIVLELEHDEAEKVSEKDVLKLEKLGWVKNWTKQYAWGWTS